MGEPGLPLTTGEGNTAEAESGYGTLFRNVAASIEASDPDAAQALYRAAVDVEETVAECGRLREQLDALKRQQWSNQNRAEVAERGHKAALARDFEQRDTIKELREQLDAARQALADVMPWLVVPSDVPEQHWETLGRVRDAARAALGVEGPAG